MKLSKNVDKYVYLSKKSNNLVFSFISMTTAPYLTAAVYSYHRKEEDRRCGFLSGMAPSYCRKYMAKAKGYNVYVDVQGVFDGTFELDSLSEATLHRILCEMAEMAVNVILKDAPRNLSFSTHADDWQPLEEWNDSKSSFKPIE